MLSSWGPEKAKLCRYDRPTGRKTGYRIFFYSP